MHCLFHLDGPPGRGVTAPLRVEAGADVAHHGWGEEAKAPRQSGADELVVGAVAEDPVGGCVVQSHRSVAVRVDIQNVPGLLQQPSDVSRGQENLRLEGYGWRGPDLVFLTVLFDRGQRAAHNIARVKHLGVTLLKVLSSELPFS